MSHITMDNAENNATAMEELQELFKIDNIKFDHKDNRVGCYPHIINICVSHIVSSLSKVDLDDVNLGGINPVVDSNDNREEVTWGKTKEGNGGDENDEDEEDEEDDGGYTVEGDESDRISSKFYNKGPEDLEIWFAKVKQNPVNRACALVRAIRLSGVRREEFSRTIKSGNTGRMFKEEGKVVMVKELQLIKDVKHRWDSLYLMIVRLLELRLVISFPISYYWHF